jgi:hypothetical protein
MAADLEGRIRELEAKVQELNDREDLRRLRYSYHEYINEGKFAEIVDLRQVESVELSARNAMDLADQVDPFAADSKRAFVAQSQAQIQAAHLHRILRIDSATIRIFFSIEEARKWIGCGPGLPDTKPRM